MFSSQEVEAARFFGERRGDAGTDHAGNGFDRVHGAHEHRARITAARKCVELPLFHETEARSDGRIGFLGKGFDGMLAHADGIGGVHDVDA
jgi:hypothetical protein